jgi:hypothetical protein
MASNTGEECQPSREVADGGRHVLELRTCVVRRGRSWLPHLGHFSVHGCVHRDERFTEVGREADLRG